MINIENIKNSHVNVKYMIKWFVYDHKHVCIKINAYEIGFRAGEMPRIQRIIMEGLSINLKYVIYNL